MKIVDVPRNTRGSIMDEPFYFAPGGMPENLPPEEKARREALLKKLDEIYPEKSKDNSKPDSN
ncbi:MAG: hypothetical protein IJS14_07845 [Lentisphaeria bacterium]|nr:hypothetical protein [Lentisphaeria bacterium]